MTLELRSLESLREQVRQWRAAGETVALVPTMGALHRGHLSLVEEAKRHAKRVVVSIFVNPTQFGPNEDFNRYPRPIERDLALLEEAGVDAAWLPDVSTMYPKGFATTVVVKGVTEPLEGRHRPGHFNGVATVVAKLLLQVQPDIACFGEKDYQQLQLIKRLVNDLNVNVEIIGVPTLREEDGLALSSRNQYLSPEQRETATTIYKAMTDSSVDIHTGMPVGEALDSARNKLIAAGFSRIDYVDLRDRVTLDHADGAPARLLVAAWLGTTRLIDNIDV
jgi:pantoate--beta-alanine ligase